MDPKDPKGGAAGDGGEVVSLDEARRRAEANAGGDGDGAAAGDEAKQRTVTLNGAEFLKPVMAAIARELAGVADPDGTVRIGGADEASRAKTAAVVKGLGVGLGQALAEAFGKWAEKIQTGQAQGPAVSGSVTVTPDDDPTKKPS